MSDINSDKNEDKDKVSSDSTSGKLLPVTFSKIMQANHYTVFVLASEGKSFPIFAAPTVGEEVQTILAEQNAPRPKTHDLIDSIFRGLEINPIQLVLNDVNDDIYYCKLFLEQTKEEGQSILEIDTRPSDGLIIALKNNLPIFTSQRLLNKVPEFHG